VGWVYHGGMSEKSDKNVISKPIRLVFTPMQGRAALEAGRVQEISQKYIDALNDKILRLTNQTVSLRKEAAGIDAEIHKIKEEADAAERTAKNSYSETLNLIISELDPPEPPWKATIVVEMGAPIGVDLVKEQS
jgi:hypothetical protein